MEIMQSRLAQYAVSRSAIHESIIDTIGKTPIVRLQRMAPEGRNVFVKLESENPGGSLKDRLGYGVIEWAEKHGHINPGQVSRVIHGSPRTQNNTNILEGNFFH